MASERSNVRQVPAADIAADKRRAYFRKSTLNRRPNDGFQARLRCRDCDRCYVSFQLIFCNGAVEGLEAAFYAVLELSISLRKLSNYIVGTRCSLPRRIALAETHHVPGDESMLGTFVFVQLSHVLSLVLRRQPRLGCVLPRRGRHLDVRDLHLDQIIRPRRHAVLCVGLKGP
jgi:hypothetical protein